MGVSAFVTICDDLSYEGGTQVVDKMPFVNQTFLQGGVEFVRFRVYTPLCGPARAQYVTGLPPEDPLNLVIENNYAGAGNKALMAQSIFTAAQAAGMRVIMIGKYLNFWADYKDIARSTQVPAGVDWLRACEEPGFLDWNERQANPGHNGTTTQVHFGTRNPDRSQPGHEADPTDYSTIIFGDQAVEAILATPLDQDILLWWCPNAPHGPYTVEKQYENLSGLSEVWQPPNYNVVNPEQPPYIRDHASYTGTPDDPAPQDNVQINRVMRTVDDQMERIMGAFTDTGRTSGSNSVQSWFLSDNSRVFGEHKLKQKSIPHLAARQTGCWVNWPGNHGSTPRDANVLAQNIDVPVTIADSCGFSLGYTPKGSSLKQDITTGIASTKPFIFGTMLARDTGEFIPLWRCVETDEGEVLVNYYEPVKLTDLNDIGQVEFYDRLGNVTTADPWELENLNTQGGAIATRQAVLQDILDTEFDDVIDRVYREARFEATAVDGPTGSISIPISSGQIIRVGRVFTGTAWIGSKGTGLNATISDTKGNAYFIDNAFNGSGACTYMFSSRITTQLVAGDSITINFGSSIAEELRAEGESWVNMKTDTWLRGTAAVVSGSGTTLTSGTVDAVAGGIVRWAVNYGAQGGEMHGGSGWFLEYNYAGAKRKTATFDQMVYVDGTYQLTAEYEPPGNAAYHILGAAYDMAGVSDPEPPPEEDSAIPEFTTRTATTLST